MVSAKTLLISFWPLLRVYSLLTISVFYLTTEHLRQSIPLTGEMITIFNFCKKNQALQIACMSSFSLRSSLVEEASDFSQ